MKSFKFIIIAFTIPLFIASDCIKPVIPNRNPNTAQLPAIIINGFADGGNIEKNNQTSQATINADFGMGITISGSASGSGGVNDFSIEILRKGKVLFKSSTSGQPDVSGKVPNRLHILGTNNSGGIGNTPMKFIMDEVTEVKVSASNYAGITNSFSLVYVPVAASQRGKDIIQNVTLKKDVMLDIFTASFPTILANGTLVALNGGPADIYLLKPSNGNIFNCNDPASTIMLQASGNLFPNDYTVLFGSVNAPLPISLNACSLGPSANSNQIDLRVTYRLN